MAHVLVTANKAVLGGVRQGWEEPFMEFFQGSGLECSRTNDEALGAVLITQGPASKERPLVDLVRSLAGDVPFPVHIQTVRIQKKPAGK